MWRAPRGATLDRRRYWTWQRDGPGVDVRFGGRLLVRPHGGFVSIRVLFSGWSMCVLDRPRAAPGVLTLCRADGDGRRVAIMCVDGELDTVLADPPVLLPDCDFEDGHWDRLGFARVPARARSPDAPRDRPDRPYALVAVTMDEPGFGPRGMIYILGPRAWRWVACQMERRPTRNASRVWQWADNAWCPHRSWGGAIGARGGPAAPPLRPAVVRDRRGQTFPATF
jgi:hypothetical protein